MGHVIKAFFKYQTGYYSAFVTIIHEFETDFIDIEFLDEDMVEIFNTSCLSYVGEKGYKKLPVYQMVYLRPILNCVGNTIENAQHISNTQNANEIFNEEYIRQN